jgi:hypothetical protein
MLKIIIKKTMNFSLLIAAGFLGYANLASAATPTISNVSGNIVTGQTVTISGSNLMDEDRTNWINMFKSGSAYGFEGSSPSGDGYACTGGTYSSAVKLSGGKSIDYHVSGATGSGQLESRCWVYYTDSDYWVRGNVRWDATGGWPTNFIKMMLGEPGFYFQPQEGSSLPSKMRMNGFYPAIPSGQLESGRWYTIEAHIKRTSPTIFEGYMDGTFLGTESGAGGGNTWLEFGIINLSGTPSSFDMHHYWDNLVLSTSRVYPSSIIEVSNNSAYGQGTKKFQEPMALGDSSSQIKLNLAGLGSGPYYLFVTNNRQERSVAYALSEGSVDTTPPAAPRNVKAS